MSSAAKVIDWNGHDVPEALEALSELLRELPPGQYALKRVPSVGESTEPPAPAVGEAYVASLARMGLTLEDTEAPAPLSTEEKADFLRDAETWATPVQLASIREQLAAL